MAETPHSDASEYKMAAPLPGQSPLSPRLYESADSMLAERQRATAIAQSRLAESPDDPSAQELAAAMQAELERFIKAEQKPSP